MNWIALHISTVVIAVIIVLLGVSDGARDNDSVKAVAGAALLWLIGSATYWAADALT